MRLYHHQWTFFAFILLSMLVYTVPEAPAQKRISEQQAEFLDLEFGMFIHFNMSTYHDTHTVEGYKDPSTFDPGVERIDTDAWAEAARDAGMNYAILTVKHFGGFCLWDSQYTNYDVMHPDCPYQKDLVDQFVESFRSRGLKVGFYYCWRHPANKDTRKVLPPECDPDTHSMDEQIAFQKKQLKELMNRYPDVFYIWNDWLDPRLMSSQEALKFFRGVRPEVLVSNNWVDWDKKGQPFLDIAVTETKHFPKNNTFPGETCWKLENNWFWTKGAESKNPRIIVKQIEKANHRNANFLLNVGPNRNGRIIDSSVKALRRIGQLRKKRQKSE